MMNDHVAEIKATNNAYDYISSLLPGWQQAHAHQEDQVRYGIQLGDLGLLIPEGMLCEVMSRPTVYPLPNTASWLKGMANCRGAMLPVYDLMELFEFEKGEGGKDLLLVMDQKNSPIGVKISTYPTPVRHVESSARSPHVPALLKEHVKKVCACGEELWVDFDCREFFMSLKPKVAG